MAALPGQAQCEDTRCALPLKSATPTPNTISTRSKTLKLARYTGYTTCGQTLQIPLIVNTHYAGLQLQLESFKLTW